MKIYKHKDLVRHVKYFCVTASICLILFLIITPKINPAKDKISIVSNEELKEKEEVKIISPSLLGFSEKNGSYQISARKITQKSNDIILEKIKAIILWKHKDNFLIESNDGKISLEKKLLKIFNDVKIEIKNLKYKFSIQELYVDQFKNLFSDKMVEFINPNGKITSDKGIFIDYEHNEINLLGQIDAKFNLNKRLFIKGENLKINNNFKQLEIKQNIYLKFNNIELISDNLKADYDNNFIFKEINLKGKVKIKAPKGIAYANDAKYIVNKQEIILVGEVELNQDNKVLKSDKLKYSIKNDSFLFEANKQNDIDQRIDLVIK